MNSFKGRFFYELYVIPRRMIMATLRFYQRSFSPDHGPLRKLYPGGYCKYHPTCSQYAIDAVDRFGITKGLWLASGRLLRCHPWAQGGIDEVPKKK